MIPSVFADTGFWIALTSESDRLHLRAVALMQRYSALPLLTTQMVLTEYLDGMAKYGEYRRNAAVGFVERLNGMSNLTIEPQTPELFAEGVRLYKARPDKEWSLTDCASFSVCYAAGVAEALAYDNHFAQAGIRPLLRD